MSKMDLAINRHKSLIALANDIIADGVDIDVEDIESIIDFYERIIATSSEQGCDNTKAINGYIDPYANIDFASLDEEGIQSLKQFIIYLDALSSDEVIGNYICSVQSKTLSALLEGNNIIIALKHVQGFMHFLGGLAEQFINDNRYNNCIMFYFSSRGATGGMFVMSACMLSDGRIGYRYFNSSFNSKLV